MGFLCHGPPGYAGPICPSRLYQDDSRRRRMVHMYEGGSVVDTLNAIYGYAHVAGFEV